MNLASAVLLGAVEGVTEFLPISSTGHLTILERVLGYSVDDPDITAFTAIIQVGAVLATLIFLRDDFRRIVFALVRGLFRPGWRADPDWRFGWAVVLGSVPIGIVGLAFKENTDDLRESPAFALVERLIAIGREVRVFDPHIRLADIYGANREFLLRALPDPSSALVEQLDDLLGWAERLIVTQNPGGAVAERMVRSGLPVLDLTRSPDRWTS